MGRGRDANPAWSVQLTTMTKHETEYWETAEHKAFRAVRVACRRECCCVLGLRVCYLRGPPIASDTQVGKISAQQGHRGQTSRPSRQGWLGSFGERQIDLCGVLAHWASTGKVSKNGGQFRKLVRIVRPLTGCFPQR